METSSCIKAVVLAANQYRNNKNETNLVYMQRQLDVLIGITGRGSSLKCFSLHQLLATECLTCLVDVLGDPLSRPALIQKCVQLFLNIAQDSKIKESLHEKFNLSPVLAALLKVYGGSPSDSLILECVHLLQKITYGHRVNFSETYIEDLINFLVKQILASESSLTRPCLGIIANLCRDNSGIQSYIKSLDNVRSICRTLIPFLSHSDQTVIVFSLTILTSLCLHEEIGEKLFNAKNINQTFQLMFNILVNGDPGTTKRYVVDLFTDMIRSSKIQHFLTGFSHLHACLKQILNLLSTCLAETAEKIFELLVSFCSVSRIRNSVCKTIFGVADMEASVTSASPDLQPTEYMQFVTRWISSLSESDVGLQALDLTREIYEEARLCGLFSSLHSCIDFLLPFLFKILEEPVHENSQLVVRHCQKQAKTLQVLICLCQEDAICRKISVVSSLDVLTQLLQFQFNSNPLSTCYSKSMADLADWSDEGVFIVLLVLDFISKMRNTDPRLDQSLSETLQDARLVPFLTHGLSSSKHGQVQIAMYLVALGSPLEDFPSNILVDALTASNMKRQEKQFTQYPKQALQRNTLDNSCHVTQRNLFGNWKSNMDNDISIQSLIVKMQTNLEVQDMKASEIIDVYEHKLQSVQMKEQQLQDLVEAKALALTQADRFIAQCRSRQAEFEAESHKMRSLLHNSEKRGEEYRDQLNELNVEKERVQQDMEQLMQEEKKLLAIAADHKELLLAHSNQSQRLENNERALAALKQELTTLSEKYEMVGRHNKSLKQQYDATSEQLAKLEEECKHLSHLLKETDAKVQDLSRDNQEIEEQLKKTSKERDELEDAIDKFRTNMSKAEQAKKELQHQVSSLELVCQQHEASIEEKDVLLAKLRAKIEKHTQLEALIHNLSSGKMPNDLKL